VFVSRSISRFNLEKYEKLVECQIISVVENCCSPLKNIILLKTIDTDETIDMSHLVSGKRKLSTTTESNEEREENSTGIVIQICPYDVLLGKIPLSHSNPGNMKFRDIIRSRHYEYTQTNRRRLKDLIAHQIVASVESQGGRFLKIVKSSHANVSEHLDNLEMFWKIVDPPTALEKVKQSLRDCNVQRKPEPSTREVRSVRTFQLASSINSEQNQAVAIRLDNFIGSTIRAHSEISHGDEISHLVNNLLLSHATSNQLFSLAEYLDRYLHPPLVNLNQGSILSELRKLALMEIRMLLQQTLLISTLQEAIISSDLIVDQNNSLTDLGRSIQSLSLPNISNFQHNMDDPATFARNILVAIMVQPRSIDPSGLLLLPDTQFHE
jgi:hypothetical protein